MHDYLKKHLIAYLGNKRSLLPFLGQLIQPRDPGRPGVFLDPFAGSGSVSRLARTLGYEVHANDWETYAWAMNHAFLTLTPASTSALFDAHGGLHTVLTALNALKVPRQEFIAAHYAPRDTLRPLPTERLFYTRENALFLDAVRERLDDLWPQPCDAKTLLLALLVYEASVHSNTSGVFKGFHSGFGGHSGDALGRILAPMQLEMPVLWDSQATAVVGQVDALEFVRGRSAEVCYLDPPYNQHQYGSNYHLLNTVVRGDRPTAEKRAGIRQDWVTTRSAFCSKLTAQQALRDLLENLDARTLIVSYNTEGVIPFDALHDLLSQRGRVSLKVQDYVTYRGGRQSPLRRSHNLEFVLVVETRQRSRPTDKVAVERFLAEKRLGTLLRGTFHPQRLRAAFDGEGTLLEWGNQPVPVVVPTWHLYRIPMLPDLTSVNVDTLSLVTQLLSESGFTGPEEESGTLYGLLAGPLERAEQTALEQRLLQTLRKLAFAKYRAQMLGAFEALREHLKAHPSQRLQKGLQALEALFARRAAAFDKPDEKSRYGVDEDPQPNDLARRNRAKDVEGKGRNSSTKARLT